MGKYEEDEMFSYCMMTGTEKEKEKMEQYWLLTNFDQLKLKLFQVKRGLKSLGETKYIFKTQSLDLRNFKVHENKSQPY